MSRVWQEVLAFWLSRCTEVGSSVSRRYQSRSLASTCDARSTVAAGRGLCHLSLSPDSHLAVQLSGG